MVVGYIYIKKVFQKQLEKLKIKRFSWHIVNKSSAGIKRKNLSCFKGKYTSISQGSALLIELTGQ